MPTRLVSVVIDAHDPPRLARWWGEVLGWPVTFESDDETDLMPAPNLEPGEALELVFGLVGDEKRTKNRVHLDLASQSTDDQRAIVERLLDLGATTADVGQADVPWTVLADPEGNELCVLDPRERYLDAGPLAAVVLDALDPDAIAPFWAAATGWPVSFRADGIVSLHHPSGRPPDLDIVRVGSPKTVKNRLHLDVAPFANGSIPAEVARLLALGATEIDVGQRDVPWTVLADPEGNELCVLTPR